MANLAVDKTIGAFEARRNFGSILREVEVKGRPVIVERHGEEIAALVPIDSYKQWRSAREAFFMKIREGAERANLSEEEANALAEKAIKKVRSQRH